MSLGELDFRKSEWKIQCSIIAHILHIRLTTEVQRGQRNEDMLIWLSRISGSKASTYVEVGALQRLCVLIACLVIRLERMYSTML